MFRVILLLLVLALIILGWALSQTIEEALRVFQVQAPIACEDIYARQNADIERCSPLLILTDSESTAKDQRTICEGSFKNLEEIQQTNSGDAFGFWNFKEMEKYTSIYFAQTFTTNCGSLMFGSGLSDRMMKNIVEQELESRRSNTGVKQHVHTLLNMRQNLNKS